MSFLKNLTNELEVVVVTALNQKSKKELWVEMLLLLLEVTT
jgi:hypothetical protein